MMVATLLGCGGTPPPADTPSHAHFVAIQEQEALVARGLHAAREEPDCQRARQGADDACAGSERICEVAATVVDADARARCDAARRACEDARGAVTDRCAGASEAP